MSESLKTDLIWLLGGWRDRAGPLWRRLGDAIVALVDDGSLAPATLLPPERSLAAALGVSRSTTTSAYRFAREAGRLESRQGSGTWTTSGTTGAGPAGSPAPQPTASAFGTLGRPVSGVIDLSLAETRCDAYTRAALGGGVDLAWLVARVAGTGYQPQGLPELRELVATHLAGVRAGAGPVSADDVLMTTGAQQAIALCAAALAAPGATALVEEASYPGALEAFRRAGLRVLPVPADERGPDPSALADLVARTRPALFYVVPVGNNPTGVVIPGERLDRLAETLARSGVTVLEDRTAVPLADPARVPAPLSARLPGGSTVTIGSTSKAAWAGLRTGWAVAGPTTLRELLAARVAGDLSSSLVSQALALAVLPHLADLAAAVRADVALSQRALTAALTDQLPDWHAPEPPAGAWRWVRVPGDARALARAAAAQGAPVTP
ncbi:MAG TPA: PLP-dependent aminotransferase family protein, partial [Kineosporiaceae bacterium]